MQCSHQSPDTGDESIRANAVHFLRVSRNLQHVRLQCTPILSLFASSRAIKWRKHCVSSPLVSSGTPWILTLSSLIHQASRCLPIHFDGQNLSLWYHSSRRRLCTYHPANDHSTFHQQETLHHLDGSSNHTIHGAFLSNIEGGYPIYLQSSEPQSQDPGN